MGPAALADLYWSLARLRYQPGPACTAIMGRRVGQLLAPVGEGGKVGREGRGGSGRGGGGGSVGGLEMRQLGLVVWGAEALGLAVPPQWRYALADWAASSAELQPENPGWESPPPSPLPSEGGPSGQPCDLRASQEPGRRPSAAVKQGHGQPLDVLLGQIASENGAERMGGLGSVPVGRAEIKGLHL